MRKTKRNQYPSEEEVEEYYVQQLHTVQESADHFNISKTKMYACLKKYNIKRTQEDKSKVYTITQNKAEIKEKIKQSNMKKYGAANKNQANATIKYIDDNFFMIQDKKYSVDWLKEQYLIKNIPSPDLSKELGIGTWLLSKICAHYGIKKDFTQRYEIIRQKTQEKYGVVSTLQLEDVKQKSKDTLLTKYGTTNVMELPEIRLKQQQTCLEKYKVTSYNKIHIQHLDIWEDDQKFIEFINNYSVNMGYKPTVANLCIFFNVDKKSILNKIHLFNLEDVVQLYYSRSHYEDEIIEFLHSLGLDNIQSNIKSILENLEIDIYLPDYKIGIEFNGDYWHSDIYHEDHNGRSTYHQDKSLLAESKGVFLFHIFEYEWNNPREQNNIKNRLRTLFVKNNIKIAARKTQVVELTKEQKKNFLNENHIQGNDHSTKQYGLMYQDELVACMTFVHPKNQKYTWELSRFCNKHNYIIQGGASKLFKHFIATINEGDTVSSYNDITKTKGELYKILGFKCVSINQPNYVWINFQTGDIRTRYQEQAGGEVERMHGQGYHRVCDCGTKTWVYTKTSE